MSDQHLLFTSESVTAGHPDKLCDQLSDAVLDAFLAGDAESRVACEALVTTGLVVLGGEIRSAAEDVPGRLQSLVREVIEQIGYDDPRWGFDARSCGVMISLGTQSADIAQGVDADAEVNKAQGAGDQGMMFGFACDETSTLMPLPIHLAHRLTEALHDQRRSGALPWAGPDGKAQVSVRYDEGRPVAIDAVVISCQHREDVTQQRIHSDLREGLIPQILPAQLLTAETKYFINPTGRFVVGGPHGDAGLTGRKIIVDTYGGMGRHGGGAFSGKDPSKVDRSAAYMARYVAKNLVAAGLARRCELQLAYAIGCAEPVSVRVDTFGTGRLPEMQLASLVRAEFDLRPAAIVEALQLKRPIFRSTAAYGHFGRELPHFSWERTDRVDALKTAAAKL